MSSLISVLLMRLHGPMQSYGICSRFMNRDTATEPTKSAIVGIIAAALGINGDVLEVNGITLADINRLRMGVRIDMAGKILKDFHTVQNVRSVGESVPPRMIINEIYLGSHKMLFDGEEIGFEPTSERDKSTFENKVSSVITNRYYLNDASFLAGLEGDFEVLQKIANALMNPKWFLSLGPKCCTPSKRIYVGLKEGRLEDVLSKHDFPKNKYRLPMVIEDQIGEMRRDVILSFSSRAFGFRKVRRLEAIKEK